MQAEDRESHLGFRNVLLSRKPFLLEGFNLNRRNPFDAVISSPFQFEVGKPAGTALVTVPELMPSFNFFLPTNFSVRRITAVLGFVPDFYYAEPKYKPLLNTRQWESETASFDWFRGDKGCPSSELKLSLRGTTPQEGFILLIGVGVQVGTPSPSEVNPLQTMDVGKLR